MEVSNGEVLSRVEIVKAGKSFDKRNICFSIIFDNSNVGMTKNCDSGQQLLGLMMDDCALNLQYVWSNSDSNCINFPRTIFTLPPSFPTSMPQIVLSLFV